MTEKGRNLAEKIKVQELVDKYVDRIICPEDANKLLIQNCCVEFSYGNFLSLITKEEKELIDEAIYEEAGNPHEILIIFSVLFRDTLFKERKIDIPFEKVTKAKQLK